MIAAEDQSIAVPLQAPFDSRLKRLVPYVFTLLTLIAVLLVHLPSVPTPVQAAGHSFTNVVGQEVRWTMFSADPRGQALDIWAVLQFEDGRSERWGINRDGIGGEMRYYHWVSWMENTILSERHEQLKGLASWLTSSSDGPVSRVTIYSKQRAPGDVGGVRPIPEVSVLYEEDSP